LSITGIGTIIRTAESFPPGLVKTFPAFEMKSAHNTAVYGCRTSALSNNAPGSKSEGKFNLSSN